MRPLRTSSSGRALEAKLNAAIGRARSAEDFLVSPAFQEIDPLRLFVEEACGDFRRMKELRSLPGMAGNPAVVREIARIEGRLRSRAAMAHRIAVLQRAARERLMRDAAPMPRMAGVSPAG